MPSYSASPTATIYGLVPGQSSYSAGTHPTSAPWRAYVTAMAVSGSNVVTLTVQTVEGNIPSVGDLATISGLPIAAANKTNVAIASATIVASTGAGTITYAATTAGLAKFACGGQVVAPAADVPEASTANTAYAALGFPSSVPLVTSGRVCTAYVQHPTAWNSATSYNFQVAINNVEAEFVSVGNNISADGTTLIDIPFAAGFIRYKELASGTNNNATVIAKFLI